MPVAASDIVWYGSTTMPSLSTPETTTNIGGAIDLTKKIVFTRIGSASLLEMLSAEAGDTTQTMTIYYLTAAGVLASETQTLNGTTPVAFAATMQTFLAAVMSAAATGIVTIRKASAGATIATLEVGITSVRVPFFDQKSTTTAIVNVHEKIFVKNQHATLALTTAQISVAADAQGVITFALETSLNGTGGNGVGNVRTVAPAGFSFDAAAKAVATGSLTAGDAQGIWLKSTLPISKAPFDTTFTMRCAGVSA